MWERIRQLVARLRAWRSDEPRVGDRDEQQPTDARAHFWAEVREGRREAETRSRR